jgi:hypothetical protein
MLERGLAGNLIPMQVVVMNCYPQLAQRGFMPGWLRPAH